jgi:hypothetical protein
MARQWSPSIMMAVVFFDFRVGREDARNMPLILIIAQDAIF